MTGPDVQEGIASVKERRPPRVPSLSYMRSIIAWPKPEHETSCRAVHQAGEVVGDLLVGDRGSERADDQVGGLDPAHVAQHHLGREDQRAGVDLVLAGVLRRGAVRRLEHRDLVGEVRARARCRCRRPARRARRRCSRRSGSASRSRRTRPGRSRICCRKASAITSLIVIVAARRARARATGRRRSAARRTRARASA